MTPPISTSLAWQQEVGPDGLVHPGEFIQVELMVKDTEPHATTEGWAWGRWRGLNLKPYGSGASFVQECIGCHQPMRPNDYVYTLALSRAPAGRTDLLNRTAAALLDTLPASAAPVESDHDVRAPSTQTTAVLFGNAAAMLSVRVVRGTAQGPAYAGGAMLALVTWSQREDPHWFGARIPSNPVSVEFVEVAASLQNSAYRRFAGPDLAEEHPPADLAAQRTNHLLALPPVILP
jgi:hypothetical protein